MKTKYKTNSNHALSLIPKHNKMKVFKTTSH